MYAKYASLIRLTVPQPVFRTFLGVRGPMNDNNKGDDDIIIVSIIAKYRKHSQAL